jgi:hypothetical protein
MSKGGRESLRSQFADGELPTQEQFGNLIDSMLHMDDEGFRKSLTHGLHVCTRARSDALITFFRGDEGDTPKWGMRFADAGGQLGLHPSGANGDPAPPLVSMQAAPRRVGIDTERPLHTLHVNGVFGTPARVGTRELPAGEPMLANGSWSRLTKATPDFLVLEVVAEATLPDSDRHALLYAVVLNAKNPRLRWFDHLLNRRKRIRAQHAWYSRRCDRLELRWMPEADGRHYHLAVRTRCDYGGGDKARIRAHVTELWPAGQSGPDAAAPPAAPPEMRL